MTRAQRLIAIFGSGETSPVMTSVHQKLIERVSEPRLNAILLDTPFGFQQNADEIAARTIHYFRDHVGCDIRLASFRHSARATAPEFEEFLAALSDATYVFAGPGSPTYALRHWRHQAVRDRLIAKIAGGGCLAFASAAAIGLGAYALPVYEIYKVGDDPSWTPGLDLLGEIGVHCAVLPHYNNREGGTHDTRFCYMGEPRLRLLESMLPDDLLILGVDEYTACTIDVEAKSVTVQGRGGVTVRRRGIERRWQRTTFPLRELQHPGQTPASITPLTPARQRTAAFRTVEPAVAPVARDHQAADRHAAGGEDQVPEDLARLVDVLLRLRSEARREQRFQDADRLRTILAECGVEVQDTPSGTAWSLAHA